MDCSRRCLKLKGEIVHAHEELPAAKSGRTGRTPSPSVAAPLGAARGPMTPATILALQRSAGNQAVSRALADDQHADSAPVAVTAQRAGFTATAASARSVRRHQTKVEDLPLFLVPPNYEAANPSAAGGARATATLGPRSHFNQNSNADSTLPRAKSDAGAHYGINFISGHLLNEQFNGDGKDAKNLTILTASANSAMKSFDNRIVDAVRALRKVYEGLSELYEPIGDFAYGISVVIEPSGSSYAWSTEYPGNCISKFIWCHAKIVGEDRVKNRLADLKRVARHSGDRHTRRQVKAIGRQMRKVRKFVTEATSIPHDLIDNEAS